MAVRAEPLPLPRDQHAELLLARLRLALARLELIAASDYVQGLEWLERRQGEEVAV